MPNERTKTLDALRTAVQMEIDGKEYYIAAANNTVDTLGKKLFQALASAEDAHRLKFIQLYGAVRDKNAWPKTAVKPRSGARIATVFSKAKKAMADKTKDFDSELDAIKTAMKMENETFDFYTKRAARAAGDVEKSFYNAIAAEEREHHMALSDYYEYLDNPSGWFVRHERHAADGG